MKVYEADGTLFGVVAGPETFSPTMTALEETRDDLRLPVLDVAADSRGRILVLDPAAGKVRVFEGKEKARGSRVSDFALLISRCSLLTLLGRRGPRASK